MKYFQSLFVVIFVIVWNTCNALYPDNYGERPHQGQGQQAAGQLRNQQTSQQTGLYAAGAGGQHGGQQRSTNLNIILPKMVFEDFEYVPTIQGYRFSYELPGGSKREEMAYITGLRMDEYSRTDSKNTDLNAVGAGGRPRMKLKNRKLSPGALKSLSG